MEYRGPEGEHWDESEFDLLVCDWGANVLRIPFNQEWVLAGGAYLEAMDRAVEFAAARGAYTVLALQWLDNHTVCGWDADGRPNFVAPLPNEASLELWRQLASRFRNEPAVLFDILSEPHGVPISVWQPWAMRLIEAIRESHPAALVLVSGVDWAYDLRGHPIPGMDGLVYSTHIYRNKGTDWDEAFGSLAAKVPVIAGEWGGGEADLEWGETLSDYLAQRQIGWIAWGWPDWPPLIEPDYTPTRFGTLVQSLLKTS